MTQVITHTKINTAAPNPNVQVDSAAWNGPTAHTITGTADVAQGGTGASILTGVVIGNGTSPMTAIAATGGNSGLPLVSQGSGLVNFGLIPINAAISNLGTGVGTALTITPGTAGSVILDGGTPAGLVLTNASGTAAALTAGHVTTNANLTGDVTSVGNATTLAGGNAGVLSSGTLAAARMPALTGDVTSTVNTVTTSISAATVTGKLLTGYTAGAGTVAATDTILQGIQKLGGLVDNAAWSTYSPTVTPGSGAFTGATISTVARYKQSGKTVRVQAAVTLTALGSGSPGSNLNVTLPVNSLAATWQIGTGRENNAAGVLSVFITTSDSTKMSASLSGGGTPISAGNTVLFFIEYEAA